MRGPQHTWLTEADHKDIRRMCFEKKTINEIANYFDRDRSTIWHIMKKMGIKACTNEIKRERRANEVKPVKVAHKPKFCVTKGCNRPFKARGWCHTCYMRETKRASKYPEILYPSILRRDYNPTLAPRVRCDHSKSTCECISPGKFYKTYLRDSGLKVSHGNFTRIVEEKI